MAKKHKNDRNIDYDRSFREMFYIGILDDNNFVRDTKNFEKVKEIKEYVRVLLANNQECVESVNKVIRSNEIKNTSKIFLVECQDLRILIAMRLDVMIRPFENMTKIDTSRLERIA
jgi:DNA polymerase elongation subunit (family B)